MILPKRTSSRSTKGKSPIRYADEQAAEAQKHQDKERHGEDESIKIPGQFSAIEATEDKLYAHQIRIPRTYTQAIKSPQAYAWKEAMDDQIQKLTTSERPVWELIERPTNKDINILPGKWVFDIKTDHNNIITKYRARWVICGNRQIQGVDYDYTYSPVATDTAIKTVLSIIAIKKLYCEQIDFITAYLNAQLANKKIYMRQPTGFDDGTGRICLLKQALYGLKQAGFLWNKELDKLLKKLNFQPISEDPCIYTRQNNNGSTEFLIIYVDDALIAAANAQIVEDIKIQMANEFKLKELGQPTKFLGCHLQMEEDTILLTQDPYRRSILIEAGTEFTKTMPIPMNPAYRLNTDKDKDKEGIGNEAKEDYLHLLGQLNWLSIKTRPDITFAVSRLQRKTSNPTQQDQRAVKDLLRYLNQNQYYIRLGKDPKQAQPIVYCDAAHQDHPDGKSTEAYIIMFGGAPIAWSSKKQTLVAPSSTMAEFLALDQATKEALWIKKILLQLNWLKDPKQPIEIRTDSANAIKIANGHSGYYPTTKWLDNRYFFVREAINNGDIVLSHIDGTENPADGLTKPLNKTTFRKFRDLIGLEQENNMKEILEPEDC